MLFNSLAFLIFFPIVTLLFYLLPHRMRWVHLLTASSIFYMFFVPQYILILLVTIVIDYAAAIWIEKVDEKKRKLLLIISILATCLVLFVFKYFEFFNQNMVFLSEKFGFYYPKKVIEIILPIGLSFHTFQSLSYVIEVYKGKQKAEKHFGIYSLYVMFYPQLVTGPIERPQSLLVQLREEKKFNYDNLAQGLRLILFGLFTKMVVADNIAVYVDQIYANPAGYNSLSLFTGMTFYSFQIYCDFFGYSTIAIGTARAMGYSLMDNFNTPYLAKSINEFWQRWHISLSTWFRDYVYISLGGNRVKMRRWMLNIMVVFILSGLWHGANWTFMLWGLAHGVIFIAENLIGRVISFQNTSNKVLRVVTNIFNIIKTFVIVTFLWVIFRVSDIEQLKLVLKSLIRNVHVADNFSVDPLIWVFLGLFFAFDFLLNKRFDLWCQGRHALVRWSIYVVLLFMIIVLSSVENFPFVYFQF